MGTPGRKPTRPDHECPALRCHLRIRYHMLMCKPHWAMVPRGAQGAVWHAYHEYGIGSPEHRAAITRAIVLVNLKLWRELEARSSR